MLLRSARKTTRTKEAADAVTSPIAPAPPEPLKVTCSEADVATVFTPLDIVIINQTELPMLFKLQTNFPQRYRVQPNPFGFLRPLEECRVQLFVVPEDDVAATGMKNSSTSVSGGSFAADPRSSLASQPRSGSVGRVRSMSGSSRSLAGLLQYRARESITDIREESEAAIQAERNSRRKGYLASRRTSDLRDANLDFSVTKRALETQMSFFSNTGVAGQRPSSSGVAGPSDNDGIEVTAEGVEASSSLSEPPKPAQKDKPLDLVRVEGRTVSETLSTDVTERWQRDRDEFRDKWVDLASTTVVVVPIRSEFMTKSMLTELIAQAEEPLGVQLLREEQETVQASVSQLQKELDGQTELLRQLSDQVSSVQSLSAELSTLNSQLDEARCETDVLRLSALMNTEADERYQYIVDWGSGHNALVTQLNEEWAELMEVLGSEQRRKLEEYRERLVRFGSNPSPPQCAPFEFLRYITVPVWVAWLAILSCFWSAIGRPIFFGVI